MLARLLRLLAIYVELKHFIKKLLQTIKQVNLKSFNISLKYNNNLKKGALLIKVHELIWRTGNRSPYMYIKVD